MSDLDVRAFTVGPVQENCYIVGSAGAAQTGTGRVLAFVRPIYSPWMWQASSLDSGPTRSA